MEISIVGYSSIVERKILKALSSINEISIVNIFSRRILKKDLFNAYKFKVNILNIEELNLFAQKCNSYFYYISTENSTHDLYTKILLKNHKNVITDKPISLSKQSLNYNLDLAKKNNCFLSEALTWEYHSQVDYLKKYLLDNDNMNNFLIRFTIPLPKKDSFRVNEDNGSGVFWDMSSYLISTIDMLNLNHKYFVSTSKNIGGYNKQWLKINYLDESYKVDAIFGFGFPYQNRLEISNNKKILIFNRIYTSDPSTSVVVDEIYEDKHKKNEFIDDSFLNYFKKVIFSIKQKDHVSERIRIKERYEQVFRILL